MKKTLAIAFLLFAVTAYAQQQVPLYENNEIPNSKGMPDKEDDVIFHDTLFYSAGHVSRPTLLVYQPPVEWRNGTAVIICPGGGYWRVYMYGEGVEVARWLNSLGITAFVLKYRIPSDETMANKSIGPLQDAQRAIQLVREQADKFGIDTNKLGILGFSAGGHLASTTGTHFQQAKIGNRLNISLRPDFMILLYPVISFADSICNRMSRDDLLGKHPDSTEILAFSNERHVTGQTPPTFIMQAENDPGVPVENSICFYEALVKNHVPAELLIYPGGGHGFGMHNLSTSDEWTDRLKNWLKDNKWIN